MFQIRKKSLVLRNLTILAGGHAVMVAEKTEKRGPAANAAKFANKSYGIVGGFKQHSRLLNAIAVDEVGHGFAIRALTDGLLHIFIVG